MRKINLQMFANPNEPVKGNRIIYLFRKLSEAATSAAINVGFTTENSRSISRDADATVTKDGIIHTPGEAEVEITVTALFALGGYLNYLESAAFSGELMEIWEVNLDQPGTGNGDFLGRYYQGYITEYELTSNAEDFAEVSVTFAINGTGAINEEDATGITVPESALKIASYVYRDTTATKGA